MKDIAAQRITMVPDTSVTLNTAGICEGTCAGMCSETLATVTHPRLTEVTYCSLEEEDKQQNLTNIQNMAVLSLRMMIRG